MPQTVPDVLAAFINGLAEECGCTFIGIQRDGTEKNPLILLRCEVTGGQIAVYWDHYNAINIRMLVTRHVEKFV